MSRFVIDTCVAAKWFISEEQSPAALDLLRRDHTLIVSDLFFPEVGSVLRKKCRRGEMSDEDAEAALRDLLAIPLEVYPAQSLLARAFELSGRWTCSVYDGIYLALAERQACPLVTCDDKFVHAMRSSDLSDRVVSLQQSLGM
jgi:predicted nucleic acid-binding protein